MEYSPGEATPRTDRAPRAAGIFLTLVRILYRCGCCWIITLPRLAPVMPAGRLLAFTLSPDDLVIASFVTGLGSSRQAP